VAEHSHKYSITLLCQALEVSESGYSAWKNRKVSQHCREDARLSAIHAVRIGLSSDMLKSKKERQEILKGSTFGKMYYGVCKVTDQEWTLI
jgi:hypothetical protein